jgi:methylmalonyl-CoA mutase
MEHLSLLAGGQEHTVSPTREQWEREAAAVLRKAGRLGAEDPDAAVWDKLTRTTLDGLALTPLGTPESLGGVADPGLPGQAPYTRGTLATRGDLGWDIRPVFSDPSVEQTAADIVTDLENGGTSVWLTLGAGGLPVARFFLGFVVIAGIVGAATASRRILFAQAIPGAIALAVTWLTG